MNVVAEETWSIKLKHIQEYVTSEIRQNITPNQFCYYNGILDILSWRKRFAVN